MISLHIMCNYIMTYNKLTPRWHCFMGREFGPWEKNSAEVDKLGRNSQMFCLAQIITSLELGINFPLAVIGSVNWELLHSRSVSFSSLPIPTPCLDSLPLSLSTSQSSCMARSTGYLLSLAVPPTPPVLWCCSSPAFTFQPHVDEFSLQ